MTEKETTEKTEKGTDTTIAKRLWLENGLPSIVVSVPFSVAPFSGRVMRVKSGYNPNSSSVGTDIPTFLAAAAGAGALATVVLNLLSTAAARIRREAPPDGPAERDRTDTPADKD